MTQESEPQSPPVTPDTTWHIPLDFEPLYQLEPAQTNAIVNGLFNLTTQAIQHLLALDRQEIAQDLAHQAHDILLDYDDDLADLIRRQALYPKP